MEPFWLVTCLVLVPGILLASWIDYAKRKVPNWLNASLIVLGFLTQGYFYGASGVGHGALGLLVGFGVLILPWMAHGMGAGDVKLMAAIGVWFGPWMTLVSFGLGAMIGGAVAVVMILSSGRLYHALGNMNIIWTKIQSPDTLFGEFGSAKSFGDTSQLLPYGVPLTAGSLIILFGHVSNWWVF
jgi:prepilin peptidase CpaA